MTASPAARLHDPTDHGGQVKTASATVDINSLGAARLGDTVTCPIHGDNLIVSNCSSTVDWNARAAAHVGSVSACGSKITAGSPNLTVGV